MESEDMTCGEDVTIYLVKKSATDEANREKKRRKQECGANPGTPLDEIHANSRKLRQCSKYFEACLSDRWNSDAATESSSRLEFYLEVQTEVLHYEDCFSRMNRKFPKPISNVTDCIELLKVALQIQYEDVVNVGMKFLAGVSWKDDDETLIRDFCNSGHFVADGASDLKARLDLTKQERFKNCSVITKSSLSRYLQIALSRNCEFHEDRPNLFADSLDFIVSDLAKSHMTNDLLEYVMMLVTMEAEKILISLTRNIGDVELGEISIDDSVGNFCWLYQKSRQGNASQVLVELILKNEKLLNELLWDRAHVEVLVTWADMMCIIFEDLLDGHLLLTTSERYSLFSKWNWIFQEEYLRHIKDLVELITNIVLTFPLPIQEQIYDTWANGFSENAFSQSRTAWMMLMVKEVRQGGPEIRALEDKDTSASKM